MSDTLPTQYRYKYEMTVRHGGIEHCYSIVCRQGAIHFHVTEYLEDGFMKGHEPSGGLEMHYRTPPDYMADQAPSDDRCPFIHQPCWHDGTSLYASETLIPKWARRDSEIEMFWVLVREVRNRFEIEGEEVQP